MSTARQPPVPQPENAMNPIVTWFEIPAVDYESTVAFYEQTLATTLKRENDPQMGEFAMFEIAAPGTAGAIARAGKTRPSSEGTTVYLWCGDSLAAPLARACAGGGEVAVPPMQLPGDIGWVAQIHDPEGNRVGLHARAA
jgi:predicted enzyme related to lactoylglutathione lyase